MTQLDESKRLRTTELATLRWQSRRETARRKATEAELKRSREHHRLLLGQSQLMQQQSRPFSWRILLLQEDETRCISRLVPSGNGTAFDVQRVLDPKRHTGLRVAGMRGGTGTVVGTLAIGSIPHRGTGGGEPAAPVSPSASRRHSTPILGGRP